MIKVLIVDDEKLIREGLKILIGSFPDINIVGTACDGEEAYNFCTSTEVDLVLMDMRMGEKDGVLGTKLINEYNPSIKVLILTTFKDSEYIREALKYGASGYLLKDSSPEKIYEAIKASISGNVVIEPEIASQILSSSSINNISVDLSKYELSDREISIIKLIADGLSNKEISEKLYLTEGTIKNNITTILSKLALRDRTQIAIFAFKNGLCG